VAHQIDPPHRIVFVAELATSCDIIGDAPHIAGYIANRRFPVAVSSSAT
jgi:hypothetical protein